MVTINAQLNAESIQVHPAPDEFELAAILAAVAVCMQPPLLVNETRSASEPAWKADTRRYMTGVTEPRGWLPKSWRFSLSALVATGIALTGLIQPSQEARASNLNDSPGGASASTFLLSGPQKITTFSPVPTLRPALAETSKTVTTSTSSMANTARANTALRANAAVTANAAGAANTTTTTTTTVTQQKSVLTTTPSSVGIAPQRSVTSTTQQSTTVYSQGIPIASKVVRTTARPVEDDSLDGLEGGRSVPSNTVSGLRTQLRVALALGAGSVDVDAVDGAQIKDASTGATVATFPPGSQWSVRGDANGAIAFNPRPRRDLALAKVARSPYQTVGYTPSAAPQNPGRIVISPAAPAEGDDMSADGAVRTTSPLAAGLTGGGYIIQPNKLEGGNQLFVFNGKLSRGSLWLKPASGSTRFTGGVTALNLVDLEDYVISVLPSEMPSSWALEALKAQAIAARSYAVANLGKHEREGYDLKATIEDQVYSGVSVESDNSNRAVSETAGIVLKYANKPISAFFHSTSGGYTELAENVWSKPLPYLKSVPDYDDASPHFSWVRTYSAFDLQRAFGNVGQIDSIAIATRTASNRVKDVLISGSAGTVTVSGETMRHLLKLPSSVFNIGYKGNSYEIAGRGFGHGLGMSQYGARSLADQGYNAAQILSYYYKDVSIDYVNPVPGI